MGSIIAVDNGKTDSETGAVTGTGTGTGRSNKSTDSADTSTRTAGTAGTGTGTGTGTAGTAGAQNGVGIEKSTELAFLNEDEKKAFAVADEDEKKRLLRNAKRRQRYQTEKTGQAKPKKVNKKKTNATPPITDDSLKLMIVTVSGLVASRPNMEHWALSEKEVDSIVTPLSNILKQYDAFSNLGEHSNEIALVMACMTIFVPRIFVTSNKLKEKKRNGITGNSVNTNVDTGRTRPLVRETTDSDKNSDKRNGGESPTYSTNNVHDVSVYGLPLN